MASLQRDSGVTPATKAMALSSLDGLRIELQPFTIRAAARAEALLRMCQAEMRQAVYMATAKHLGCMVLPIVKTK